MSEEDALKKAKEWWKWIQSEKGITTWHMCHVDRYLKEAGATREDIGATNETVEKAKIKSYIRKARMWWELYNGDYGTPWSHEQTKLCLYEAGFKQKEIDSSNDKAISIILLAS